MKIKESRKLPANKFNELAGWKKRYPVNIKVRIRIMSLWLEETAFSESIGQIIKEIPKISPIFAMLDPIILPKTKPVAPLFIAEIDVNSSGADVAIETMVRPTTMLGTPNDFARFPQLSESRSPPFESK